MNRRKLGLIYWRNVVGIFRVMKFIALAGKGAEGGMIALVLLCISPLSLIFYAIPKSILDYRTRKKELSEEQKLAVKTIINDLDAQGMASLVNVISLYANGPSWPLGQRACSNASICLHQSLQAAETESANKMRAISKAVEHLSTQAMTLAEMQPIATRAKIATQKLYIKGFFSQEYNNGKRTGWIIHDHLMPGAIEVAEAPSLNA